MNPTAPGDNEIEAEVVRELVVTIISQLVLHSFASQKAGWGVLEATISILRTVSKVFFH